MPALPFLIGALCVLAIAYRYYSAFLAARVLALDPRRPTPARTHYDGANFRPTNRWVLFGHHFAAITGAGPLIGPVLAAQFGFLPGFLWLLIGVTVAGAVHDFVILSASIRHGGKSLAEIARREISPMAGACAGIAILFVLVIALAGLGLAVVNALSESAWGTFTIGMTIPLAIAMGLYIYKLHGGAGKAVRVASLAGVLGLFAAVIGGRFVALSGWGGAFLLSRTQVTLAIAAYGFVAAVLPVWLLLVPRDYLSSYMKLGTIAALILAVLIVHPELKMPAITSFAAGGGPIIPGKLFPYVFITIACGAISGFHALVASGTTPKMIERETDARMIGYGAMLLEGLIGIVALVAASALHPADYFAINTQAEKFAALGMRPVNLAELSAAVGESLAGRTGGAVSLAVGMAQIFSGLPFLRSLMSYWYHFAIMFEALFILTTIDTGTRVARFVVQEALGPVFPRFGRADWLPGNLAASFAVVAAWAWFILTGSISTIWPMFGVANQLLATISLSVATAYIARLARERGASPYYALCTAIPLAFVGFTTIAAGIGNITGNFVPLMRQPGGFFLGTINTGLTCAMIGCVLVVAGETLRRHSVIR